MENLLYYLLKVAIATSVFSLTYHLLFRKSRDFVFNRFYLLGSFLLSFALPLISFKTSSFLGQVNVYFLDSSGSARVSEPAASSTLEVTSVGLPEILFVLYFLGLIYHLVKMFNGYRVAASIGRSSRQEVLDGVRVYVSDDNIRAFTFFDRIVIGRNILNHPSISMVLSHESVHSRERHFYDIIIAELLLILQWFNPFARLHAQSIRNNLEFRADDLVTRHVDTEEYLLTMLSMVSNRIKPPLFTELNSSNLKKRVIMMKSKSYNKFANMARLALIPVIGLLLVSLSGKENVVVLDNIENGAGIQKVDSGKRFQDTFKSQEEIVRFISYNIKYPLEARKSGHIGTVVLYAKINEDGSIKEVLERNSDDDFVDIKEVVIVGYQNKPTTTKYGSREILAAEGRRVIESFPKIEIAELNGQTLKFRFKFLIR